MSRKTNGPFILERIDYRERINLEPSDTVLASCNFSKAIVSSNKDVSIKRAHGFSDSILENAEKVLRLPK